MESGKWTSTNVALTQVRRGCYAYEISETSWEYRGQTYQASETEYHKGIGLIVNHPEETIQLRCQFNVVARMGICCLFASLSNFVRLAVTLSLESIVNSVTKGNPDHEWPANDPAAPKESSHRSSNLTDPPTYNMGTTDAVKMAEPASFNFDESSLK